MTYPHGDHLGSVSVVTDANGNLAAGGKQEFDPWGSVRAGGIASTSMNFTGQRRDDTGLLFYNARYYNPQVGRFVSAGSVVLRPLTVDFHEGGLLGRRVSFNSLMVLSQYWISIRNSLPHSSKLLTCRILASECCWKGGAPE